VDRELNLGFSFAAQGDHRVNAGGATRGQKHDNAATSVSNPVTAK
jgi:hypothetical protein